MVEKSAKPHGRFCKPLSILVETVSILVRVAESEVKYPTPTFQNFSLPTPTP